MTVLLSALLADPQLSAPPSWRELKVELDVGTMEPGFFNQIATLRQHASSNGWQLTIDTASNINPTIILRR